MGGRVGTLVAVSDAPTLDQFPAHAQDKLRYGDTDRQGHVNNAVFATLLETGRVEVLHGPAGALADTGASFVIARLVVQFVGEMHWPGTVEIGTRVARVGRSSVTMEQALFQGGRCCATAESVIVQVDDTTRSSKALSVSAVMRLKALSTGG